MQATFRFPHPIVTSFDDRNVSGHIRQKLLIKLPGREDEIEVASGKARGEMAAARLKAMERLLLMLKSRDLKSFA